MTSEFGLIARAKRDHIARQALDLPPVYARELPPANPLADAVAARLRHHRYIAEAPERAFPDTVGPPR